VPLLLCGVFCLVDAFRLKSVIGSRGIDPDLMAVLSDRLEWQLRGMLYFMAAPLLSAELGVGD
jgi:hypothetical protein